MHTDITKAPSAYSATAPFMGSVNGTDFAEKTPATMVRVGSGDAGTSHISVSTSSGSSWWAGQEPSGVTGGGTVAMSADGSRIVWSAGRRRRAHVVDARLELDEVDRRGHRRTRRGGPGQPAEVLRVLRRHVLHLDRRRRHVHGLVGHGSARDRERAVRRGARP